jgi:hypothetical protein
MVAVPAAPDQTVPTRAHTRRQTAAARRPTHCPQTQTRQRQRQTTTRSRSCQWQMQRQTQVQRTTQCQWRRRRRPVRRARSSPSQSRAQSRRGRATQRAPARWRRSCAAFAETAARSGPGIMSDGHARGRKQLYFFSKICNRVSKQERIGTTTWKPVVMIGGGNKEPYLSEAAIARANALEEAKVDQRVKHVVASQCVGLGRVLRRRQCQMQEKMTRGQNRVSKYICLNSLKPVVDKKIRYSTRTGNLVIVLRSNTGEG